MFASTLAAQDKYDQVAASFELDSVTVFATDEGWLKASDFIRYTMDDTSLFHSFYLIKRYAHQMNMQAAVTDQKKRFGQIKRVYQQENCQGCRTQPYQTIDSSGYFYSKRGKPISETYQMLMQFFSFQGKDCNLRIPPSPKGIVVLNKPKDIRQQKELIKRFIFAPHTLRVDVPFFGNKMRTNIFESPTADYYSFKVDFDMLNDSTPVYVFHIKLDSEKASNREKSVLIKEMITTFRVQDMAILHRYYDLYYPGWLASCDLSIDIKMQEFENKLVPHTIEYDGEWRFPTKGKDKAKIKLEFSKLSLEECSP